MMTAIDAGRVAGRRCGLLLCGLLAAVAAAAQQQPQSLEPFIGITRDGTVEPGLFPLRATGVPTDDLRLAAEAFLQGLAPGQRDQVRFAADDDAWRRWNNVSRAPRLGLSFHDMDDAQRESAFRMIREGLSARGFEQARDIMRLNGYLGALLERFDVYDEFLYWITVMGEPSVTEPWGWQLEGHHLVISYFVLGDQVVMTPTFMGSEPVSAASGIHAGIEVLQQEQDLGLEFMQSLSVGQQEAARLGDEKTGNNALAQAYSDNLVLNFEGLQASRLETAQRERLLELIGVHIGNISEGHARVRMEEVAAHIDDTWFAWLGDTGPEGTFYYRIQSPVILIEFDHQTPVALDGARVPDRRHIHSVVRTPNGNDYGRDLLRQHYDDQRDNPAHGHVHDDDDLHGHGHEHGHAHHGH